VALEHSRRSLEIAQDADIGWVMTGAHELLSTLYERKGASALALKYSTHFHQHKANQLRVEAVRELEAQKSRTEIAYTRLERDTLRARYGQLLRNRDALAGRPERRGRDALVDDLTGLTNRRALEQWAAAMANAYTNGVPCALLLIDLDHFKRLNDALGHATGDAVLRQFGALLRDRVRDVDLAARLGGEGFTVPLSGSDGAHALCAAEGLRAATADPSRPRPGGRLATPWLSPPRIPSPASVTRHMITSPPASIQGTFALHPTAAEETPICRSDVTPSARSCSPSRSAYWP
jgi:diguanylate cyclase (GGDEF)-like protein